MRETEPQTRVEAREVSISAGGVFLKGDLATPERTRGVVLFAHGSGSSRHSPRNQFVAQRLQEAGLATLLMDLLTLREEEEDARTARLRFAGLLSTGEADRNAETGSGKTPRNGAGSIATVTDARPRPAVICARRPPNEWPTTTGFLSSRRMIPST